MKTRFVGLVVLCLSELAASAIAAPQLLSTVQMESQHVTATDCELSITPKVAIEKVQLDCDDCASPVLLLSWTGASSTNIGDTFSIDLPTPIASAADVQVNFTALLAANFGHGLTLDSPLLTVDSLNVTPDGPGYYAAIPLWSVDSLLPDGSPYRITRLEIEIDNLAKQPVDGTPWSRYTLGQSLRLYGVPEPSGCVLIAIVASFLAMHRRRVVSCEHSLPY